MRISSILLAGAAVAAALAGPLGCPGEPRDEHRQMQVKSRGYEEAYDALTQALVQRFDTVDTELTSRDKGVVTTVWRVAEEPNRMVRRRARGTVSGDKKREFAMVEVAVDRQISTKKTQYGELDKQSPSWAGGTDIADSTLEKEILKAVQERTKGELVQ